MTKKYLKAQPGQRIDEPDFSFATKRTQLRNASQDLQSLASGSQGYVFDGFIPSNIGSLVTVTRDGPSGTGAAILGVRTPDGVQFGHVVVGGRESHTIDVAGMADGTYDILLSAHLRDTDYSNRAFWNPDSGSGGPVEFNRNVPTREALEWSIVIVPVSASPGPEWLRLGQLVISGAGTSFVVTDTRPFFFEGRPSLNFSPNGDIDLVNYDDPDREQYGAKTLRQFVRTVQSQLGRIIDSSTDLLGIGGPWWTDPKSGANTGSGPRSLTQLNSEKLARNGSQRMTGSLEPNADSSLDLGSSSLKWSNVYADQFVVETGITANAGALCSLDSVLANDIVTVQFEVTQPAPADPSATSHTGRMFKDQVVVARARVVVNDPSPGSITLINAWNAGSASLPGAGVLRVNFQRALVAGYTVMVTDHANIGGESFGTTRVLNKNASYVEFGFWPNGSSSATGATWSGADDIYFEFVVIGELT